jgi:hypothetical protein
MLDKEKECLLDALVHTHALAGNVVLEQRLPIANDWTSTKLLRVITGYEMTAFGAKRSLAQ